ncbi:hypothetical protein [Nocardia vermiculata]|uniref:hypothetical protein n=1 Tax=Nocardia vermiculata TaxID=257274 RepID=UPI000A727D7D|nr:hypothetical protein [Nocardia vermiculata]
MQRISVAKGLHTNTGLPSGSRLTPSKPPAVLAEHALVVDGVPVTVMIERPEVDRAGIAWRCRLRVVRGNGRLEQSQVVGGSAGAVLQQALDLAGERLGVSEEVLLGGADVGGILG